MYVHWARSPAAVASRLSYVDTQPHVCPLMVLLNMVVCSSLQTNTQVSQPSNWVIRVQVPVALTLKTGAALKYGQMR